MADYVSRRYHYTEPPQINMSRIKVTGSGGLGMLAMAALVAVALPEIRSFILLSIVFGVLTGLALIAYRRVEGPWHSDDDDHMLFHPDPVEPLDGVNRVESVGRDAGRTVRLFPGADARQRLFGLASTASRVPSTLSGLCPETLWRWWPRPRRGPVSCTN